MKKFLAVFLALTMIILLGACGKDPNEMTDSTNRKCDHGRHENHGNDKGNGNHKNNRNNREHDRNYGNNRSSRCYKARRI